MEEVTKKVAPGKINHKNAIKACQIVLYSSKITTKKPSLSLFWFASIYQAFLREQWTKNANSCNSMLFNYLLNQSKRTQAKRFMNFFTWISKRKCRHFTCSISEAVGGNCLLICLEWRTTAVGLVSSSIAARVAEGFEGRVMDVPRREMGPKRLTWGVSDQGMTSSSTLAAKYP